VCLRLRKAYNMKTIAEAVAAATHGTKDDNWRVRRQVVAALGQIAPTDPRVLTALDDEHRLVRRAAIDAVGAAAVLGDIEALEAVIAATDSTCSLQRYAAVCWLSRVPTGDPEVIAELLLCTQSRSPDICQVAISALARAVPALVMHALSGEDDALIAAQVLLQTQQPLFGCPVVEVFTTAEEILNTARKIANHEPSQSGTNSTSPN
jgi:HEAT repeat protein